MSSKHYDISGIGSIVDVGKNGPKIKNNSGVLEARNTADNAYVIFRALSPSGNDDVVTKGYFDANTAIAYAQYVSVAKSGGDYTTATAALASISDAAANKKYAIQMYPGVYDEQLTLKDYIDIIGVGPPRAVVITSATGTVITASNSNRSDLRNVTVTRTSTSNNDKAVDISAGTHLIYDCVLEQTSTNAAGSLINISGSSVVQINTGQLTLTQSGTTSGSQESCLIHLQGSGALYLRGLNATLTVADANDTATAIHEQTTASGTVFWQDCDINIVVTNGSYVGTACAYDFSSANTNKFVVASHFSVKNTSGTPGGTGCCYTVDTPAGGGYLKSTANIIEVTGFTNNYWGNVSDGDELVSHGDSITAAQGCTGVGTFRISNNPSNGDHSVSGTLEIGRNAPSGTTNTVGSVKFWSAGDNAYYSSFTAGTQTGNAAYTLPTALPGADALMKCTNGGVMSWSALSSIALWNRAGTVLSPATAGDSISVEYVQLDATPTGLGSFSEGKLFYDEVWKTVSVQCGRDVTLQVGQEELCRVYNNTGETIYNGQAVYVTGVYSGGTNDVPTIALAQADVAATSFVLGVLTQDIPDSNYGLVTVRGNVNDLDTNRIGSAYLVTQGMHMDCLVGGTAGNSYTFTVIDTSSGGLTYTEVGGAIIVDLGGATPTRAQLATLINTTTPSAYIRIHVSTPGNVIVASSQSFSGGVVTAVGDILYLSAAIPGKLRIGTPDPPYLTIQVGRLITKSATVGRVNIRINQAYRLDDLADVSITSAAVDQILKWNGSEWINGPAGSVSAGPGIEFFLCTPVFNTKINPSGISQDGTSGNGIRINSLSKTPVTSVTSTVTISNASPAVVTWASHGLPISAPIVFTTTGSLPTGLTPGTTYYILSTGYATGSFRVSLSVEGTAINTSSDGSGTHTCTATELTTVGQAVSDTRASAAWLYNTALGRTTIDAGVWDFTIFAGVNSVAGGRVTTTTRNMYQVVPVSSGSVTTSGAGANSRTATITSSQFAGTYFAASATNTVASYLQTPSGIYQITAKSDANTVTITVPTGYANESSVTFNIWNKLFGTTSVPITSITPNYIQIDSSVAQPAFTVAATDKLGQIGFITSNNTTTVTTAYNGTVHNTHFSTPLITLHNNLAGLNAGDYQHLTAAQFSGLTGGGSTSLHSHAIPTAITVAAEASDTTCFPAFFTAASGDLGPKTHASVGFNAATYNLGIGTTTPGVVNGTDFTALVKLHVKGSGSQGFIVIEDNTNAGLMLNDTSQTANSRLWGVLNQSTRFSVFTYTDAGVASEKFCVLRDGKVGIGTVAPLVQFHVVSDTDGSARFYTHHASNASNLMLGRSKGTAASPTIVENGTVLGGFYFLGYDGANMQYAASIKASVDGTPGTGDMPGKLLIGTTPDGASSPVDHVTITNAGFVGIGTAPACKFHVSRTDTSNITVGRFDGYNSDYVYICDNTAGYYSLRTAYSIWTQGGNIFTSNSGGFFSIAGNLDIGAAANTHARFYSATGNFHVGDSSLLDDDGTPVTGRLVATGTTNDGTTNIFVGRDSDKANVCWINTDGLAQFVGGAVLGLDAATNTAGSLKLWSAGANNYYTSFTAGTQTGDCAYTLPLVLPSVNSVLQSTSAGAMSWVLPMSVTAAPGSDHTVSGLTITLNANETHNFGDVCYINSDGQAQLIDADAIATMSGVVMATATISADADGVYLLMGIARDDTWTWTVGGLIYGTVTGTTGNTLSQTAPTGTNDVIQILGVATHADRMLFNPQLVQVEHT